MSAQISALRQLLVERFPDAAPLADRDAQRLAAPVATGLAELDRIFPGGGLPRGKLTAWVPQGGATAVLLSACHAAIAAGERAAWIDAARTAGPEWQEGPLLIRPRSWPVPEGTQSSQPIRRRRRGARGRGRGRREQLRSREQREQPGSRRSTADRGDPTRRLNALRCAEVVLRSGGFALVVLTGAAPERAEAVRLMRAAREGGSALVILTAGASMAGLRVVSRLLPHDYRWAPGPFVDPAAPLEATVQVRVHTLGWNREAKVVLPVTPYELRLSLDPALGDRRGADR